MTNMDEEFGKMVPDHIVRGPQQSNGRTDYVHLAEQVADGQVKLVEAAVADAQALLEKTRKDAEALLAAVKSKDREIVEMTNRIAALGEQVLAANEAFHAAAKQEAP